MKSATLTSSHGEKARTLARVAITLVVVVLLLVAWQPARGDELSDIPGAFADVGIGAGPMGMGGAVVASVDGAQSLFWNPAGLAGADTRPDFALAYGNQMGLVPYSAGAGRMRLGGYSVGVGLLYSGDDVLSETTAILGVARGLRAAPWALDRSIEVGLSLRTRWASYGNNGSVDEQVTGSAAGLGLDLGAFVPLTDTATFGVAARDVFNVLNWDSSAAGSYAENVPAALALGVSVRPSDSILIEVDLDKSLRSDNNDIVRAGAEVRLFGVASLRGGYSTALPEGERQEFAVGAGATATAAATDITLDLAYLFGDLENTLRLTIGFAL